MRYFFHIRDGVDLPDQDGLDLPDDKSARTEAVMAATGLLSDLSSRFWDHGEWKMSVVDETGREVCSLVFEGRIPD